MSPRIPYWDNVKGMAVLLVVLGHILEKVPGESAISLYKLIYLFHMPLFIVCSGYFAACSLKKIACQLVIPYLLLQTISCLLTSSDIQFAMPRWALWYLVSLASWRLTVPLLRYCGLYAVPLIITAAFAAGIGIGFIDPIGQEWSLSRTVVFYPFFLMGYFAKQYGVPDMLKTAVTRHLHAARCAALVVLLAVFCVCLVLAPSFPATQLHESQSFAACGSSPLFRLTHYLGAALCCGCILLLTPHTKTVFTPCGRYSYGIYVLHILIMLIVF